MTMVRRTLNSTTSLLGKNEKDTIPFGAAAACVPLPWVFSCHLHVAGGLVRAKD